MNLIFKTNLINHVNNVIRYECIPKVWQLKPGRYRTPRIVFGNLPINNSQFP